MYVFLEKGYCYFCFKNFNSIIRRQSIISLIVLAYFLENKTIAIKGKMIFKLHNVCDDVIILYQFVRLVPSTLRLFTSECRLLLKGTRWRTVLTLVNSTGNDIPPLNILMFDKVTEIKIVQI